MIVVTHLVLLGEGTGRAKNKLGKARIIEDAAWVRNLSKVEGKFAHHFVRESS